MLDMAKERSDASSREMTKRLAQAEYDAIDRTIKSGEHLFYVPGEPVPTAEDVRLQHYREALESAAKEIEKMFVERPAVSDSDFKYLGIAQMVRSHKVTP